MRFVFLYLKIESLNLYNFSVIIFFVYLWLDLVMFRSGYAFAVLFLKGKECGGLS